MNLIPTNGGDHFLIYQTQDGKIRLDVRIEGETVWLSQQSLSDLFGVQRPAITKHLKNIFDSGELDEKGVCSILEHTAKDRKKYATQFYNLDAIIAVGYRVNSFQATRFRIWATEVLKKYIQKGFAIDSERMKSGKNMNYFDELLAEIREIRLSERVFYQKIKDIYKTSIDYDPSAEATILFFKIIQNKLLWAISQNTAAELVVARANGQLPFMGMTSYDKSVPKQITKAEATTAKNYLTKEEIEDLGLLVEQYLAFAESQARRQIPMYMKDWISRLDAMLQFNGRELLTHSGKIRHDLAAEIAGKQLEIFRERIVEEERIMNLRELENDIQKAKDENSP